MTETTGINYWRKPVPLKAKTLRGAKIAAAKRQVFEGTTLAIGESLDDGGYLVKKWVRIEGFWLPVVHVEMEAEYET
jgi:hypothetical protein